ncbi:hybrid sensor histidine kinase/response regulator [Rubellimicrobium rubrum]|nr:ATP-binding protein [Rubellimicrobium rubrum]
MSRRILRTMTPLLEREIPGCCFADEQGRVLRGDGSVALDGLGDPLSVADFLSGHFADADAVVERLWARAQQGGLAQEDLQTRRGDYRLAVSQITRRLALWRLERRDDSVGTALDSHDVPIAKVSSMGTILSANDAFQRLVGSVPQYIEQIAAVPPLVPGRTQSVAAAQGAIDRLVVQVVEVDGQRRLYFLPTEAGGVGRVKEWDAIEDLPVPLMKLSRSGVILAANRHARALLPLAGETGVRLSDLLEGLGRPVGEWVADIAEGRPTTGPQVLRGTGAHHDTVVRVTLNLAGPSEEPHLIAVFDDVTEYKALEAQFVQSQKMQALGQLAGGVAHDFNNLLTAISGHCDLLLLRHDQGDPEYADLIQIRQNVNRAASLVGQLLAFSRKQSMMPETIDLRESLADLTHLLNRLVGEKVRLQLRHDPSLLHIRTDKRQLEQVIMNLVVNARDAMPDGGEILIETGNCHLGEPQTWGRAIIPPGRYVQVKVIDHGTGIPPERLHKIFEPFYTTKKPGEGTGLGLSTAYGIVKQSGGFIFAESTVGQGSTFTLWFPAHDKPKEQPAPVKRTGAVARRADGVVLLVEDEAPVRAFAGRALRMRGYTVLEADCGRAALDLLADPGLQVDVVVSDVVLPDMDGPTWIRIGLSDRPDVRVIFASGYAEEAFSEHKAEIRGSVFLPKPFSLVELTSIVEEQMALGARSADGGKAGEASG